MPPTGYLDGLRTDVERLVAAFEAFLGRAPDDEIAAMRSAVSSYADVEAIDGCEHVVPQLIANWALTHASAHPAARGEIDVESLWGRIEKFLEGLLDDALHGGVDPMGTIFGFEKYEVFDAKWLEYITGWLEYSPASGKIANLPKGGTVVQVPDDVRIAVVGDWGTGIDYPTQSAGHVATAIADRQPDYTVHLGDVYYDGVAQQQNFLTPWGPAAGSAGSFTLNSNHDMYDGANGYLDITLAHPDFSQQRGKTHFALQNSSWVVVGLDTAGPGSWDKLYMDGDVDDDQLSFLAEQAQTGKRLVVLTHHQGIAAASAKPNDPLYTKIVECIGQHGAENTPWYWYWGHIHAGYVHADSVAPFRGRCAGHGAIPWARARALADAAGVEWYEQTPSAIGSHRVANGFALLTLSGESIQEMFIDETGAISHTMRAR